MRNQSGTDRRDSIRWQTLTHCTCFLAGIQMTETAHHLLLVQITGSPLEPANSLHLGVHSQRVLPRDARLLLGSLIQAMQLVWLVGGVEVSGNTSSGAKGEYILLADGRTEGVARKWETFIKVALR